MFHFTDWLKNGEDHPLKVTAALSMGNLCCSKENSRKVIGDFAPGYAAYIGQVTFSLFFLKMDCPYFTD